MRNLLFGLGFFLISALAPRVLGAQSPAQRDSIEAFRIEMGEIGDSVRLLDRERQMIDSARIDRDNAMLHVKLGFLAYRLGEVTGDNAHYDDAGGEFEWASELAPGWPYAWYGLGLAELALGEHSVIALENLRQALGRDYLSKATRAFARATEADPSFAQAVVDLAETAMRQRVRARTDVALDAVRRAASGPAGSVPGVQLARGYLERSEGDVDSALAAFGAYVRLGGDAGIGAFERARTLYRLARPDAAARAYFHGVAEAQSPEAIALYREDLSWVATAEELATFDTLAAAERPDWVAGFWRRRDAREGHALGATLQEHFRRYFYALDRYRLVSRHRRYDVSNPYRNKQQVFDDRGIIYMRHGEPTRIAVYNDPTGGPDGIGIDPNESWLYQRPDGNLLFHFVARGDVQDYKLVESLADVLGLGSAIALQSRGETSAVADGLFASRVRLDPVYQRLASGQAVGRDRLLAEERRAGSHSIAEGTTTDSYPLRFEDHLGTAVQEYVVGRPDGGGEVLIVFAIPGRSLDAAPLGGSLVYAVRFRVVASSLDDGASVFFDSVRTYTSRRRLEGDAHLTDYVELPLPAGSYRLLAVATQPGRDAGDLAATDSIDVVDFGAPGLVVSDLIVGSEGSGLVWAGAGDSVDLSPLGRYPATSNLTVYYQLHGLTRGAPYRARLEVRKQGGGSVFGFLKRLFGGGGPSISLAFDGVAAGRLTPVSQRVDASNLAPGRYRVRLRVTDVATGQATERESTVEIVRP